MLRFRLFFSVWFIISTLSAQSDKLILADQISWATEVDFDFCLRTDLPDINWLDLIKLLETDDIPYRTDSTFLAEKLFRAVLAKDVLTYADPYLTQPITDLQQQLNQVLADCRASQQDSILGKVRQADVVWFRAKQRLYLDEKKGAFVMRTISVAPCALLNLAAAPEKQQLLPLFWFRAEDQLPDIQSNDVAWAALLRGRNELNTFNPMTQKVIKKTFETDLVTYLFDKIGHTRQFSAYAMDDKTKKQNRLSKTQFREKQLISIDTVVIFDPETYEEKLSIVRNAILPESISSIRVYQTWVWNERQHQLGVLLKAVVLVRRQYNSYDDFWDIPFFYLAE